MTRKDVTVQIMLGGKSTRMGTDKALVKLGGKTLLDRAVERWQSYGGGLQLSVGSAERSALAPEGITAIEDLYVERGPMGGLHAGLQACSTPLLLLVAVDSPFLGEEQADLLVRSIGDGDACVYTIDGRPQPLFGLYRAECAPMAEELLVLGENRMNGLLKRLNTVYIPTQQEALFRNLNTPEELAEAQRLLG